MEQNNRINQEYLDQEWNLLHFPEGLRIDRKVFLASVISGFITHVYCMVNLVENEDTITPYTQSSVQISSTFAGADTGRWLSGAVNFLQGWYRTPIISGILIILIIAFLAQIFILIFHIETAAGAFLIAVFLEVSSPTQAYMTLHEAGYPLSALLSVVGVYYLVKGGESFAGRKRQEKKGAGRSLMMHWLLAFLCESISLVILPVNISCAATVILMLLMAATVSGREVRFSMIWRWTGYCLSVLLCSGIFLLFSSKALQTWYGTASTSYQGAAQAMNGDFLSSIGANYLHSVVKFFIIGGWKIQTMPRLRFAYYLCYMIDLLCVVLLLWRNRKERGLLRILHMMLYLLLLPAAVCTISVVSYGFMYRGQHRMSLILFLCGTVVLVEAVLRTQTEEVEVCVGKPGGTTAEQENRNTLSGNTLPGWVRMTYYVMTGCFILMIYGGILFDNIGYVNQHHVMKQDQALCTRILSSLDQTKGFSYDQPVYFLNILSTDGNESISPMKYDPELYSVIWPVATTDLYAYGDSSIRFHMESYEGVSFEKPSESAVSRIEASSLRSDYAGMKSWEFRIGQVDGVWVVIVKTVMPPNVAYG